MAERIFDAFHDAGEFLCLTASNTGSSDRQIYDFGNSKQADDDGDEVEPVPEVQAAEGVAQRSGLRINANGRQHQTDAAGQKALDQRSSSECADKRYSHDGDNK